MTAPEHRAAIESSLELAAERAGDLTPLVYAKLFARNPEMEALFWRDESGKIRGEMLSQVFDAILDFISERRYAGHLIQASVSIHTEYGVPLDVFGTFFGVVSATVREVLGEKWTPQIGAAWDRVLHELEAYVKAGEPV